MRDFKTAKGTGQISFSKIRKDGDWVYEIETDTQLVVLSDSQLRFVRRMAKKYQPKSEGDTNV